MHVPFTYSTPRHLFTESAPVCDLLDVTHWLHATWQCDEQHGLDETHIFAFVLIVSRKSLYVPCLSRVHITSVDTKLIKVAKIKKILCLVWITLLFLCLINFIWSVTYPVSFCFNYIIYSIIYEKGDRISNGSIFDQPYSFSCLINFIVSLFDQPYSIRFLSCLILL